MGCFSFKYCDVHSEDTRENRVIIGKNKKSYVLIPKEFGGGHIVTNCYDGYGFFGGHDIFELIAEWNRKQLLEIRKIPNWEHERDEDLTPIIEAFVKGGDKAVQNLLNTTYKKEKSWLETEWKRSIGIELACYDEDNARLPYPIKIASNENAVYEKEGPSLEDPLQGCL